MRVHPDFQRRGLGRLILQGLEERALALGFRTVRLDTTERQIAARRLYESAGYRETGRGQTSRFTFVDFAKTLRATPVLIVTGPPGVGKTTTAEILAARSARAVHLKGDAFFGFIRSGHVEPWRPESHEQNRVVMRVVAAAAAGYAEAGYFTIVDGIVIPGWFLEPLRDSLSEAGHRVACAVLRAPLPVCIERVRSREGEPFAGPEVVERLWRSFADVGSLERNVLDLGERNPEEAADMLAQRLAAGLLEV